MRRALVLLLAACGSGGDAPPGTIDAPAAPPDAATSVGWRTLATATWSVAPSSEKYRCARRTVPVDTWIKSFRPVAPLGTHHTVLSLDSGSLPDGDVDCGPIAGFHVIYASGIGTNQFDLPAGTGVRIPAGTQIVLNLHLYNTDDTSALTGTSGVEIDAVDASQVQNEAEAVLAGPLGFTIPTGVQPLTFSCTMPRDVTLFAVAPHMHRLGIHMKVEGPSGTILDEDYSFESQMLYHVGPIALSAGAVLHTTCTWDNDTGGPVNFGDSTDAEMCFAIIYRYPAALSGPICSN